MLIIAKQIVTHVKLATKFMLKIAYGVFHTFWQNWPFEKEVPHRIQTVFKVKMTRPAFEVTVT